MGRAGVRCPVRPLRPFGLFEISNLKSEIRPLPRPSTISPGKIRRRAPQARFGGRASQKSGLWPPRHPAQCSAGLRPDGPPKPRANRSAGLFRSQAPSTARRKWPLRSQARVPAHPQRSTPASRPRGLSRPPCVVTCDNRASVRPQKPCLTAIYPRAESAASMTC